MNLALQLRSKKVDINIVAINRAHFKDAHHGEDLLIERALYFDHFLACKFGFSVKIVNKLIYYLFKFNKSFGLVFEKLIYKKSPGVDYNEMYALLGRRAFALPTVAAYLKEESFDVIHAAFAARTANIARQLSELSGIPYTFEAHAQDLFVELRDEEGMSGNEKVRKAAHIFTISRYNQNYINETYGYPANKISVFRVPFNKTYCDNLKPRPRKTQTVISVCRLHPIKGLDVAIKAIKLLVDKYPDIEYTVIGDGPLKNELSKQVVDYGLQRNVFLLGSLNNEAALDHILEASIFIMPSVITKTGNRDGIPTALIEAMYLNTPVISTTVSGIPELIDSGNNGLLVAPENPEQLADKIDFLLSNASQRDAIAAAGRERVRTTFYEHEPADVFIDGWKNII